MIAETYEHAGLTVEIHYDEDPQNPRGDTQLGVMMCWHPNYELGDEQFSRDEFDGCIENVLRHVIEERKAVGPVLPLYILDHSGITMTAGAPVTLEDGDKILANKGNMFHGAYMGWDTSWVGFIFATPETLAETGAPEDSIERQLRGEVEEYDSYLRGEVYGFVVEDADGEHVDSCWGFIGDIDYCKSEANETAEHEARAIVKRQEQEAKEAAWAAQQSIPTV